MSNLKLCEIERELSFTNYKENWEIGKSTTYKSGGNCTLAVFPSSVEEMKRVLSVIKGNCPYFVMGRGSNVLVSDKGYDGIVVKTDKLNGITYKGNLMICECGVTIQKIVEEMLLNSFSGLEFASQIPASVGGALAMNAGCFNRNISDLVCYVVTDEGTYNKEDCKFEYRKSRFSEGETVLKACFKFDVSEPSIIEENIKYYKSLRKTPKGKSCGSVFKNDGYFAGKVIDECGLKGKSVGKAKVSEKHANYVVAEEGVTSSDIFSLISTIKEEVFSKKGITLSEELIYLGEF